MGNPNEGARELQSFVGMTRDLAKHYIYIYIYIYAKYIHNPIYT